MKNHFNSTFSYYLVLHRYILAQNICNSINCKVEKMHINSISLSDTFKLMRPLL